MSVSTPTSRFKFLFSSIRALTRLWIQRVFAIRVPHAVHAFEQLGASLEMVAKLRLHAREVISDGRACANRARRRRSRTKHRARPRREVRRVLADVVVPQPVVRRVGNEPVALLHDEQILLQADAFEAARAAYADELER